MGDRENVLGVGESFGSSANFSGILPLWLDAGYRVSKLVYVGAYVQYGFLFVPEKNCPSPPIGCSAHDLRFGPSVHFHFVPDGAVDPWAGIGVGYEASTLTIHNDEQSATRTNRGFELANVQIGADVHSMYGIDWGPFLSFSFDAYRTETQTPPSGESKTYSLAPTLHYFLVIGARVQFDL